MPRALACLAVLLSLAFAGCTSTITTAPMPSAATRLSPNPVHIYIAPFDTRNTRWLVARDGIELVNFKEDFQTQWTKILTKRLNKLAPTDQRWVDDLPDHGWLVAGEFVVVDQGSRFLRTALGNGFGQTTLETRVYVYDLSVSKTQYVLSFRTGVPDAKTGNGAGSGTSQLSGLTAAAEPYSTASGLGSGLKQDTTRSADAIADVLAQYL